MIRPISLLASAVLLAVSLIPVRADEPVVLRYKFSPDKALLYRTETGVEQTQTVAEMKIETRMNNAAVSAFTLEDVTSEGDFHLKSENKRLHVQVKIGPLGEYKYDSTSSENESGSLLGQNLTPLYDRLNGAQL